MRISIFNSLRKIMTFKPSHNNCTRGPKSDLSPCVLKLSNQFIIYDTAFMHFWVKNHYFEPLKRISAWFFGNVLSELLPQPISGDCLPGTITIVFKLKQVIHFVKKINITLSFWSFVPKIFIMKNPNSFEPKSKTLTEFWTFNASFKSITHLWFHQNL